MENQVLILSVDDFEKQFRPEINMNSNGKRPNVNVASTLKNMPFTQLESENESSFLRHEASASNASDIIVQSKFSVDITNAKLKCTIFISNY